ncbi:sialin-like [Anneissia japonica]|uniref:sialin-like n=1 Tax=Anneissia japonica TaxID=1529436 RepID=UPI00142595EC|nr:sialin-like [Anneissia japonica]
MIRYFIACTCFVANVLFYTIRLNLSIAITVMVRHNTSLTVGKMELPLNTTKSNDNNVQTFDWDEKTQQMILGAFFYGYAIMPIPGSWLAEHIGGKRMIGFSIICSSILSILIPWAAGVSVGLVVILRGLDGMVQGNVIPATVILLQNWAPKAELNTIISIAFAGMQMGITVGSLLSTRLCSMNVLGGWPLSFYTYGSVGLILALFWTVFVYDTANEHPCISQNELALLDSNPSPMESDIKIKSVPWLSIFTSPPVLAIVISYFSFDFGVYFFFTDIPTFLSSVLGYDFQTVGVLVLLMCISQLVPAVLYGKFMDFLIQREYLSALNTRKLYAVLSLGIPAVCLLALGYASSNEYFMQFLIITTFGIYGVGNSVLSNPIDLSPMYSGIITGVVMTISSSAGFIGPFIVGLLTQDNNVLRQWSIMFKITAGIQIFGMIIYLFFAQVEEQEWSCTGAVMHNGQKQERSNLKISNDEEKASLINKR